jgi:DNA-binding response OmpR family regulator
MSKTILMVDHRPVELEAMTVAMQGKGYHVITASDGEEAISKAAALHPDVILLDIVLPKKNGFQVCRQLKTAPGTKDIKIVLVSSKSEDTDRFWGLRQGADEYLSQPYQMEDLVNLVGRYA